MADQSLTTNSTIVPPLTETDTITSTPDLSSITTGSDTTTTSVIISPTTSTETPSTTTSEVPPPASSPPPPPPPPLSTTTAPVETSSVPTDDPAVIVTVTPSATSSTVVVDVTITSFPSSTTPERTTDFTTTSSTSTSTNNPQNPGGTGGAGLGLTKTVVAIAVPLISVALIIIALIFWWRRRKRNTAKAILIDNPGPEYGYAAGAGSGAKVLRGGSASDHSDDLYEMTSSGEGYRGWGSTGGGRKAAARMSGHQLSSVGKNVSDAGYGGHHGYGNGIGNDKINQPAAVHGSPSTCATDSGTVGVTSVPAETPNTGGLSRGDSNASSNYSGMSASDQSELGRNRDSQFYEYDGNYSMHGQNLYANERHNSPPIIQDVQARRHTRIETPTDMHYPQQGNSGIAQNF